jgi:hypothetical protein
MEDSMLLLDQTLEVQSTTLTSKVLRYMCNGEDQILSVHAPSTVRRQTPNVIQELEHIQYHINFGHW